MTKKEIQAKIDELKSQLDTAPDDESENTATAPPEKEGDTAAKVDDGSNEINGSPKDANDEPEQEVNSNDEIEEQKQIEPQTNGAITDDVPAANQDENSPALATAVVPGPKSVYEAPTNAVEVVGTELPVTVNYDEKFATIAKEYAVLAGAIDKLNVQMAQILTRIDLVQEVTDKVVTPDHDTFLTQAVNLLV